MEIHIRRHENFFENIFLEEEKDEDEASYSVMSLMEKQSLREWESVSVGAFVYENTLWWKEIAASNH